MYSDIIIGGNEKDTINGTLGADSITGGAGTNTIKYTSLEQPKGDKIYLTKGENLTIDVSEIEGVYASGDIVGKDMVITVYNATGTQQEKFTLVNFGTKDVLGSNGQIKLITSKSNDLKAYSPTSDKGTWHNDFIDKLR